VASLLHLAHVPDTDLLFSWAIDDEKWNRLSPRVVSIADAAHARGLEAHVVVEQVVFRPILHVWDDFDSVSVFEPGTQPVEAVLDKVKSLRDKGQRYVLYVHLWGSHIPLKPPPPYRGLFTDEPLAYPGKGIKKPKGDAPDAAERYVLAYHQQMRWYEDASLRLLESLDAQGVFDDTFVLMTADHGTTLGETKELPYHYQWAAFEEVTRVPMVMAGPGVASGRVVTSPVGQIDVARTALASASVPMPEGAPWRGLDLRKETRDLVVTYAVGKVSVRDATHRCDLELETGATTCYAHAAQETPVPVKKVPRGKDMVALARKVATDARTLNKGVEREARKGTDEDIEALKEIGYVE
jgi:hypothetical protein